MADEVRERLLHRHDDAGYLRQLLAELLEHLLAAATGIGIEADDDLGGIDPFGMFVELGAAGAATEVEHPLHLLDPLVHHPGDGVRGFERRAGGEKNVDLNASLVEGREEIAAELRDDAEAHGHRRRHRHEDRGRVADARADGPAGEGFEHP